MPAVLADDGGDLASMSPRGCCPRPRRRHPAISPVASCIAATVYGPRPYRARGPSTAPGTGRCPRPAPSSPGSCGASLPSRSRPRRTWPGTRRGYGRPRTPASTRPQPGGLLAQVRDPAGPGSGRARAPAGPPPARPSPRRGRRTPPGRALERLAGEHQQAGRLGPPGGVPQQRGSDSAAARRRQHVDGRMTRSRFSRSGSRRKHHPWVRPRSYSSTAIPDLDRVGRVLEPAPQPLQRPRRPVGVVNRVRRPHDLEAHLGRRPVRCVPLV